jgi:hypothetical protein
MTFVAVAVGGAAVIGAGASMYGASQQAGAAKNAASVQQNMYNQTTGNESQFLQSGQAATGQLNYLLGEGTPGQNNEPMSSASGAFGSLNAPFTADTFKSMSPAYNFQLQQGAQGTLNQDSGAQGAESGAALKDLQSYNQNFANTSFNNAFNQYQTQQNNVFGRLSSLATMGQGAASNQATGASTFAGNIGNSMMTAGGAQAAGTVGAANALGGGLSNAAIWAQYGGGGSTATSNPDIYNNETASIGDLGTQNGYILSSDRRLKKNIEVLSEREPGMMCYRFHYVWEPDDAQTHVGYMADEVFPRYPHAIHLDAQGYWMVDYRVVPHV